MDSLAIISVASGIGITNSGTGRDVFYTVKPFASIVMVLVT